MTDDKMWRQRERADGVIQGRGGGEKESVRVREIRRGGERGWMSATDEKREKEKDGEIEAEKKRGNGVM